jgi:hypothetical protein
MLPADPDFYSAPHLFLRTPSLWLMALVMAGACAACILWSWRLRKVGMLSSQFRLPLLLGLIPIALGITCAA